MAKLLSKALARMVAAGMTILGVWIFTISFQAGHEVTRAYILILVSSALGAIGGVIFLLSIDGPYWMRTRWARAIGWSGMLLLAALPWSLWMYAFGAVLLTIPTLLMEPNPHKRRVIRKGQPFIVTRVGKETRVSKKLDGEVTVELVSTSADEEALLRIAGELGRSKTPTH